MEEKFTKECLVLLGVRDRIKEICDGFEFTFIELMDLKLNYIPSGINQLEKEFGWYDRDAFANEILFRFLMNNYRVLKEDFRIDNYEVMGNYLRLRQEEMHLL